MSKSECDVLVTGAAGLVGSHLCRTPGTLGLTRSELDITRPDEIDAALEYLRPSVLINAAAQANVNLAETQFERSMEVNGIGPVRLADACRARGIRMIHISTDYVLDGADRPGVLLRETDPVSPRSRYAETKLRGEQGVLDRGETAVRIQWVYRPGGRGFFTAAMKRLAQGLPLQLVVDQVGAPTPSFVVAEGLLAVARGTSTGLYHLACSGETSAYAWIRKGAQLLGLPFDVEIIRRSELAGALRPARSVLDSSLLVTEFGYRPPSWREALRQSIESEDWTPDSAK
mgnify:CR=1 FL=1